MPQRKRSEALISSSYGFSESSETISDLDLHLEEISLQGFTVLKSIFSAEELAGVKDRVTTIYQQQELKVGKELMLQIGDENICRCPMSHDESFVKYASKEIFMAISESLLGDYFILSVQNANISKPSQRHVQSAWHRDLPYQNFTSSQPLALNFLVAVDDFTEENGGVVVVPFSHKMDELPSSRYIERNARTVTAKAGDVISFDSMLIHRAGVNRSAEERFSFNHMYTRPFIKQQYDYATLMRDMPNLSEQARKFSGVTSRTAKDGHDFRMIRKEKMK